MRILLAALFSVTLFWALAHPAEAQAKRHIYRHVSSAAATPQANPKFAAFLVDGDTGKILYQENADKLRHPASLTKMMTIYLLFEALEKHKVTLDTKFTVSAYAAGQAKTNLNLTPGETITVRDAILAVIVKSANDVAVVVAENLAGSEANFAKIMNERARQLGMKNTYYKNANGLHDPQQVTTAKDLALLGIALKKHYPQYFPFFARREFTFDGVNYTGHNHVMENYPGADGLKTGFVNASGFNLVTTATRRGISLVGVVLGGRTFASRDAQMIKLLDAGFEKAAALKSISYISSDYVSGKGANNDNASEDEADDSPTQEATKATTAIAKTPATAAVQSVANTENSEDDNTVDDVTPPPTAKTAAVKAAPAQQNAAPQVAQAEQQIVQTYETNSYVRSVAAPAPTPTKSQRYKSSLIVTNPPAFVPTPKPKPNI